MAVIPIAATLDNGSCSLPQVSWTVHQHSIAAGATHSPSDPILAGRHHPLAVEIHDPLLTPFANLLQLYLIHESDASALNLLQRVVTDSPYRAVAVTDD